MNFDVIITTYNRPAKIIKLVNQILQCSLKPQKLIVVDSSDQPDTVVSQIHGVTYCNTPHKNQPYQRYLGFQYSVSEIVVFFDDDVTIENKSIFNYYLEPYSQDSVAGVAVGLEYEGVSKFSEVYSFAGVTGIKKAFLWSFWNLTGNPPLAAGQIGLAGLVGGIPAGYSGPVQYFQGPNMSFRRQILRDLFDEDVFDLYKNKLGKGEDKMLSMRANLYGTLFVNGRETCLRHPPEESHYYRDLKQYAIRTAFSRIILSKIYCEVFGFSFFLAILHFYWFMSWRLFFSLIRSVVFRSNNARTVFFGHLKGVILTLRFLVNGRFYKSGISWSTEAGLESKD